VIVREGEFEDLIRIANARVGRVVVWLGKPFGLLNVRTVRNQLVGIAAAILRSDNIAGASAITAGSIPPFVLRRIAAFFSNRLFCQTTLLKDLQRTILRLRDLDNSGTSAIIVAKQPFSVLVVSRICAGVSVYAKNRSLDIGAFLLDDEAECILSLGRWSAERDDP